MRKLFSLIALLLFAGTMYAEELDATIPEMNSQQSGYSYDSRAETITADNCLAPNRANPIFDLVIVHDTSCVKNEQVYYRTWDFYNNTWSQEQLLQQCTLGYQPCKLPYTLKLGARGTGVLRQDLFYIRVDCGNKRFEKTFGYTISHAPTNQEIDVSAKVNDSQQQIDNANTALAACGACCDGTTLRQDNQNAQNFVNRAREDIRQCELAHAYELSTQAYNQAKGVQEQAVIKKSTCTAPNTNQGTQPPAQNQTPPANTQPPAQNNQQPPAQPSCTKTNADCDTGTHIDLATCTCVLDQIAPPAQTGSQDANETGEAPASTCPMGLLLLPLVAGAWAYSRK